MAGKLSVALIIEAIDRATAPMRKITNNFKAMSDASRRANKQFEKAANMRQSAQGLNTFATAARGVMAAPIKEFAGFEKQMDAVKAKMGDVSDVAMQSLIDKAKELGATTQFTATETGQGFEFLAQAGWSVQDSLKGIAPLLDLATASGTDLGRTSDVLSDLMGGFRKGADDATDVADKFAVTMSSANVNLETMFETLKIAAPITSDVKAPMEEVLAITGLLGNVGLKGSLAGTAIKGLINNIRTPSKAAKKVIKELKLEVTDSTGEFVGMTNIIGQVDKATQNMPGFERGAKMAQLFGIRAQASAAALAHLGEASITEFTKKIQQSEGASKKMADTMLDNLGGSITILESAISGLKTALGEAFGPTLRSSIEMVTKVISGLTKWATAHPKLSKAIMITGGAITGIATALTGLMFTLAAATTAFGVLNLAMGGTTTGAQLFAGAISPIKAGLLRAMPALATYTAGWTSAGVAVNGALWPFWAIAAAIAAITAAVVFATIHWDKIVGIWERFKNASLGVKIVVAALLAPIVALTAPILALAFVARKIIDNWGPIKVFFVALWDTFIWGLKQTLTLLANLVNPLGWFLDTAGAIGGAVDKAVGGIGELAADTRFVLAGGEAGAVDQRTSDFLGRTNEDLNIGGRLDIRIDSQGRQIIDRSESDGILDFDVATGTYIGM